jgi:hypothetical protein
VRGNSSELKISVQLPELGKVEVRAVTSHDVTTAHLTTFRHDTLQVLAADRGALEQALKLRNVTLASLESRGQNSRNQDSHNQDSRNQDSRNQDPRNQDLHNREWHSQGQTGGQQGRHGSPFSDSSSGGMASTVAAATTSSPSEAGTGLLPDYSSISVRA